MSEGNALKFTLIAELGENVPNLVNFCSRIRLFWQAPGLASCRFRMWQMPGDRLAGRETGGMRLVEAKTQDRIHSQRRRR